jgi:hypothetical protein
VTILGYFSMMERCGEIGMSYVRDNGANVNGYVKTSSPADGKRLSLAETL